MQEVKTQEQNINEKAQLLAKQYLSNALSNTDLSKCSFD